MSSIMNQWTDELRYAPYSSWTSAHLENLTSIIAQSVGVLSIIFNHRQDY